MARNWSRINYIIACIVTILFASVCWFMGEQTAQAGLLKTTIIDMEPGKTYDIGEAGPSTQYTISKSGDYWIKGQSTYAFVRITGGNNVKLHLMDGLDIDTGAMSYVGSEVSAVIVEDYGGTVNLCTEPNAHVHLTGYLTMPGICKNGTRTKLIFTTADTSREGRANIASTKTHFSSSPGIGSSYGGDHTFGNVLFESGKWYVMATDGAAIGASKGNDANGITINGGYIYADHKDEQANMPCGPGIGVSGYGGKLDNLTINGGYIEAHGEESLYSNFCGPGIGAGYGAQIGTITINGGTIKAYGGRYRTIKTSGEGCSGIGVAGMDAYTSDTGHAIIINGGDIKAYAGGSSIYAAYAGIGSGSIKYVTINGGNVYAEGNIMEKGIEAGYVTITGGKVVAKGGDEGVERIVEYHTGDGIHAKRDMRITGGNVTAVRKDTVGGNHDMYAGWNIYITGGSVNSSNNNKTPINDSSQQLKKTTFGLKDYDGNILKDQGVDSVTINGIDYTYGVKDTRVNSDGEMYFWLPDGAEITKMYAEKELYTGYVNAGVEENAFLNEAKFITIRKDSESKHEGGAWIAMNEKALFDMQLDAEIPEGYSIEGLYFDPSKTASLKVADGDGKYLPNVHRAPNEQVTDADGKWVSLEVRRNIDFLYYNIKPIEYNISFDSNIPDEASTKAQAGGATASILNKKFDEEVTLPECGFTLPGYDFDYWSLEEDGTGVAYHPGDKVRKLTTKDGDTVKVYARWKPKEYTVTFNRGDATSGDDHTQRVFFDAHATLDKFSKDNWGWAYDGFELHGWTGPGFGSFYDDGEDFYNLCTLDPNGNPIGKTMTAEWIGNGKIYLTITNNGVPVQGLEGNIKLERVNVSTATSINVIKDNTKPWLYYTNEVLLAGEYRLSLDGNTGYVIPENQREFQYNDGESKSIVLDYYTVSVAKDDGVKSAYFSNPQGGAIQPATLEYIADDTEVRVHAYVNDGYHFDGYSAVGIRPVWDQSKPVQNIKICGRTELTAHAAPNLYHVKFDANSDTAFSGKMDTQDIIYSQTQKLFKNVFKRLGAVFTGWNTMSNGSGIDLSDNQDIDETVWNNLGYPANDSIVSLYAKWNLDNYNIDYNLDGGNMPAGQTNPVTYNVQSDSFTLVNPEWINDEYEFEGWIGTDCYEPTKELTIQKGSVGDRHYAAVWGEVTYSVKYNTDGGSDVATQTVKVHQKATQPENPSRKHYTFEGWFADKECTKPFDFSKEITGDTVVYAKWNQIMHTITYDLNGGTLDGKTGAIEVMAGEGDVINVMNAPYKEGCTFLYWKGSEYYPGDEYKVEDDHVLTAQWQENSASDSYTSTSSNTIKVRAAKTGDASDIDMWMILILSTGIIITILVISRGKHYQ